MSRFPLREVQRAIQSRAGVVAALFYLTHAVEAEAEPAAEGQPSPQQAPTPAPQQTPVPAPSAQPAPSPTPSTGQPAPAATEPQTAAPPKSASRLWVPGQ